ncbi:MAG: Gfo/Idh/MocA family oxidoreductase [Acidobacteria bacterium]|nr:Gfo/Idh/MocA family oxidoreductase [Acidobacteriota bacterium]MBI3655279.1 Gfo/Idh/MocA family oxidoreductase [Acidobacteriota bacterium]
MTVSVGVGIVGAGYWGINLVRNFAQLPSARLLACCDLDADRFDRIRAAGGPVFCTTRLEELLANSEVEGVIIATSAAHHAAVARQCLLAGKHVFVEKPLTLNAEDAKMLVHLAEERRRVLMVGHLMQYHPGTEMLKQLIEKGELGEIFYLYSQRLNLGIVRKDENALWSFAPHDLSVILYLFGEEPLDVTARGESYIQPGIEDVVFVNLRFKDRRMAQIQLSWLDPHKVRRLTIVGSKKMVVFDDVESSEKIRIYDKGVDYAPSVVSYNESLTLRSGDILIPSLKMTEPLRLECQHFVECIRDGKTPRSDGLAGLRVVKVLEAAQVSMQSNGRPIQLTDV